jgi:hypothetical protein
MKNKFLKLMAKSLEIELSESEKAMYKKYLNEHPEWLEEKKSFLKIQEILKTSDFQFKPFFSNRVMTKIRKIRKQKAEEIQFASNLNLVFRRIVYSGIAAIVLILLTIYLTEGSLSYESLFGIESFTSDDVTAYIMFDF